MPLGNVLRGATARRIGVSALWLPLLLSVGVAPSFADTPSPDTYVPASAVEVSGATKEVAAADVNGDGCDDLVTLHWDSKWVDDAGKVQYPKADLYPTVQLRLNAGCARKASEGVAFTA